MRSRVISALLALGVVTPAQAAAPLTLAAPVKHDVQCFVLYSIGVGLADNDKDKTAAMLGLMYFVGKLRVNAPDLDLQQAIRQEADGFKDNPDLKAIGSGCDDEVQARSSELKALGQQLKSEPAAPAT